MLHSISQEVHSIKKHNQAIGGSDDQMQTNPLHLQDAPNPNLEFTMSLGTNCFCGKQFVRKLMDQGSFVCPVCEQSCSYKHKELRLACHWYGLIRCCGKKMGEYVKCMNCNNHFYTSVLQSQVQPQTESERSLEKALLMIAIVQIMLARHQPVAAKDIDLIHTVCEATTDAMTTKEDILAQLARSRARNNFEAEFGPFASLLSENEANKVMKAMLLVSLAVSDGKRQPKVAAVVHQAKEMLDFSETRYLECLNETVECLKLHQKDPTKKHSLLMKQLMTGRAMTGTAGASNENQGLEEETSPAVIIHSEGPIPAPEPDETPKCSVRPAPESDETPKCISPSILLRRKVNA